MSRGRLLGLILGLVPWLADAQVPSSGAWRLDASIAQSRLSGGRGTWRDASATATYRPRPDIWLSGGLQASERFGFHDTRLAIGAVKTFGDGGSAHLQLASAPNGHLLARSSLQLGGETGAILNLSPSWNLGLGLDGQVAQYSTSKVGSLQPFVRLAARDGRALTLRIIETFGDFGTPLSGYAVRAEFPLSGQLRFNLAYADAPESDSGVTLRSQSESLGTAFDLNDSLTLRLDATRDRYSRYHRDEIALGIARRF